MKKFLLLSLIVSLLAGCAHDYQSLHVYVLDTPLLDTSASFAVEKFELPKYLCSTEMRYTTENGELKTLENAQWALPLDRLLRDTAQDALRNLPRVKSASSRTIRITRLYYTEKKILCIEGDITRKDDEFGLKSTPKPFRKEYLATGTPDAIFLRETMTRFLKMILQEEE